MVKTHPHSRFCLKSIENIRNSTEILLQIEKTESKFTDNGAEVYLCEAVSSNQYNPATTVERLTNEIIRVNEENRKLHKKIARLEKLVKLGSDVI